MSDQAEYIESQLVGGPADGRVVQVKSTARDIDVPFVDTSTAEPIGRGKYGILHPVRMHNYVRASENRFVYRGDLHS